MGDSEIRSASYLVKELSRSLKSTIEIEPDNRAFARLSRSVVALGSGASNEVTRLILAGAEQCWFPSSAEEGLRHYRKASQPTLSGKLLLCLCWPGRLGHIGSGVVLGLALEQDAFAVQWSVWSGGGPPLAAHGRANHSSRGATGVVPPEGGLQP